jgi:hypothetical protein
LEAGFGLEEYVIRMLERKVGSVNGKEVTDPRTFTSLLSPSLSQTALMPQKIPSVSLDADRYIAHPETPSRNEQEALQHLLHVEFGVFRVLSRFV